MREKAPASPPLRASVKRGPGSCCPRDRCFGGSLGPSEARRKRPRAPSPQGDPGEPPGPFSLAPPQGPLRGLPGAPRALCALALQGALRDRGCNRAGPRGPPVPGAQEPGPGAPGASRGPWRWSGLQGLVRALRAAGLQGPSAPGAQAPTQGPLEPHGGPGGARASRAP